MIAISVIAIIAACLTKCIKHCICVWLEIPVLFIISITLIVFGAILTVPANGGAVFVEKNCQLAAAGKLDDMDGNVRKVFEPISDFDNQFQKGVNMQMCTPFCKCPGSPTDAHYKEYQAIPKETYQKYDRYFSAADIPPYTSGDIQAYLDNAKKVL